ncbi:hypothetical protein [Streptomyces sp. NPDC021622]|uniref:hypothetical protein n=1 Tax=Streptomyces sp. NPDC021622 TaxID=3155013 RepID=UPI0033E8CD32
MPRHPVRTAVVTLTALTVTGISATAIVAATGGRPSPPGVTVGSPEAEGPLPDTRRETVEAWEAELARAGKRPPAGWDRLTTGQLQARYLKQKLVNDGPPQDIDPQMGVAPCGSWTWVLKPADCW